MKIGVYTQPLRTNYGGILQAWAMQKVLRDMGHDVTTFDPDPFLSLSWKKKPYVYCKRFIGKLLGRIDTIYIEKRYNTERKIIMQNLCPFIDKNINRTIYRQIDDIRVEDYDVLLAGSDQVWRPRYNQHIEHSFFDFAYHHSSVKRIAYAASFGTDKWEYTEEQTRVCAELVKKFDSISVREKSGVDLCKKYFEVDAVHVLDPTMLLPRKDYEELIDNGVPTHKPEGNLLSYILDETEKKNNFIKKVAEERNLKPFQGQAKNNNAKVSLNERIQPPIEQWLRNFRDASFVITDSFHACVFSIIFGKPFIVINNEQRGSSRLQSLLSMFMIKDHLISSTKDYDSLKTYSIPSQAYHKWDKIRISSMTFLNRALCDE